MKCNLMYAAILIPLLGLGGCMSSDAPPGTTRADKFAPQQVAFAGHDVADSIAIGKIERTFDSSGILHIRVPLQATTDLGLMIDYRITFYDDGRGVVEGPAAWQGKSLPAGAWETIYASSSNSRARDFQIEFRFKPE